MLAVPYTIFALLALESHEVTTALLSRSACVDRLGFQLVGELCAVPTWCLTGVITRAQWLELHARP